MTTDYAGRGALFCSLADPRSWTDPITNISSVFGMSVAPVVRDLLDGELPLPSSIFPMLVHEATHHSFFTTRVFSALATLRLRASFGLVAEGAQGRGVRDMAVYERALAILRPLAEGAAMFAECDAKTGFTSDIISLALGTVADLFVDRDRSRGLDEELVRLLATVRISRSMLDRKVGLLGTPVHSAGGGYSLGYLALKTLWLHGTGTTESDLTWDESDRWLRYVRKFFLEDPGLLIAILDPAGGVDEATTRIASALRSRLLAFFVHFEPERDLEIFEAHAFDDDLLSEDGHASFSHSEELCGALHVAVADERRAQDLFRSNQSRLFGTTGDESAMAEHVGQTLDDAGVHDEYVRNVLGNVLLFNSFVGRSRRDLHIASVPVGVAIGRDLTTSISVGADEVFSFPFRGFGLNLLWDMPKEWERGKRLDGRVDVFVPMNEVLAVADLGLPLPRLVLISVGDEPVALQGYGYRDDDERDADLDEQGARLRFLLDSRRAFALMDRVAERVYKGAAGSLGTDSDELLALVDGVYFDWVATGLGAPYMIGSGQSAEVLQRIEDENVADLRRSGVLEVFGLDRKLIEGLALLGLCNSIDPSAEFIAGAFSSLGLSVEEFVADLDRLRAARGVPMLLTYGSLAMTIV